ncbi:MAG: dockerin type I repeat-containing protein [Oscillospiraceae bacterium]|jgi:hypothetical protein|nr:dockerin type I repeat-containing protein [Oscillospiraceae bacterium]
MINKVRFIPILSIILAVFLFAPSVTAFAAETPIDTAEAGFTVSYEQSGKEFLVCFDYGKEVVKRLLGDMNNDGKVTAADARTALRSSAKLAVLSAEDNVVADIDCDGEVAAADARTILRVSAKLQAFKIDAEKETLIRQYAHFKNTTKELTVQGKTLNATYFEPEKASERKHDTLIYKTADGDNLGFDAVTGQLTYLKIEGLYGDPEAAPDLRISEEQAIAIAEKFFAANCDMSKYTFLGCKYHEYSGDYMVEYGLLVQGYRTTESMGISITNLGEIRFFSYHPYVFDDIDIKSIDEQALLAQLDQQVRAYAGDSFVGYEIEWRRLAVDKNNQLIMEYAVDIEFSITDSDGRTEILTAGVVFSIKV